MTESIYIQITTHSLYPAAVLTVGRPVQERIVRAIAEALGLDIGLIYRVVAGGR